MKSIILGVTTIVAVVVVPFAARAQSPQSAVKPSDATPLQEVLSKFDVRVYGRIKMDTYFDTSEFSKYNDFVAAVKAGPDYKNDSSNFNPRDTRLGLTVSSSEDEWLSEGQIETDFYGANNGNNLVPRMRLGFVRLTKKADDLSILAGQDWTPIATLAPATIDFGILAAGGNLWQRVPQVTVRKKFDEKKGEMLLSVMRHRRQDTAEEGRSPWLLGRASYLLGDLSLALGAGWKTDDITLTDASQESVTRYLGVLEVSYKSGPFSFAVEPWIGAGLDEEFYRYDLGVNTTPGHAGAIKAWGGFASTSYALDDLTVVSLGYGLDDPNNSDLEGLALGDRQFEMNEQLFTNIWYQLTKSTKVGAEVMRVETTRPERTSSGWRFTTSVFLSF